VPDARRVGPRGALANNQKDDGRLSDKDDGKVEVTGMCSMSPHFGYGNKFEKEATFPLFHLDMLLG
jgi:hypothetical protein